MGAPGAVKAGDQPAAEALLTAFKTISAAERRRHASVLNYWLSVRGDKEFPPLHDLDPLELSDAGPNSILMELISGGHDADIRHLGEALRDEAWPERIIDAPNPSVLACIAKKLPIVAISRDFLAFEDEYETAEGKTRCSVTLLPLSAGGAWVDYVYALVSVETQPAEGKETGKKPKAPEPELEAVAEEPEPVEEEKGVAEAPVEQAVEEDVVDEAPAEAAVEPETVAGETGEEAELEEPEQAIEAESEPEAEPEPQRAKSGPGFSKLLDSIAGLTGFYGSQPVKVEPVVEEAQPEPEPEAAADEAPLAEEELVTEAVEQAVADEEPVEEPAAEGPAAEEPAEEEIEEEEVVELAVVEEPAPKPAKRPAAAESEGSLQNKLTEVRAKADEARMARLKANAALYEGLGAAYDFALDAEDAPEEYLRLVEAQGLKIQLRSPMKPVVKLAFAGMCDDSTIKQLEAVLSWAFEEELPRGTLPERVEAAGGIAPILNERKAA